MRLTIVSTVATRRKTTAASLELTFDLDGSEIVYLGSVTNTDSDRLTDLDTTNEFIIDFFRPQKLDVLTQEVRISSTGDNPFQWQAGLYYLNYEREIATELRALGGFGFFDPTTGLPIPPTLDPSEQALVVALPWEVSSASERKQRGSATSVIALVSSSLVPVFDSTAGRRIDAWMRRRARSIVPLFVVTNRKRRRWRGFTRLVLR